MHSGSWTCSTDLTVNLMECFKMSSNKKMNLEPFDIDRFIAVLKRNRKTRKAPIITFISKRGATPFEILVSTILSLRTKDEVTAAAAERLFEFARTPEEILRLDEKKLKELNYRSGFTQPKQSGFWRSAEWSLKIIKTLFRIELKNFLNCRVSEEKRPIWFLSRGTEKTSYVSIPTSTE